MTPILITSLSLNSICRCLIDANGGEVLLNLADLANAEFEADRVLIHDDGEHYEMTLRQYDQALSLLTSSVDKFINVYSQTSTFVYDSYSEAFAARKPLYRIHVRLKQ